MRPGARPATRDTCNSVGLPQLPATGSEAHALIPAHKHTEGSAPPESLGAPVPERIGTDDELECRLVRVATGPPAGAAFGWSRRLGALLLPARRLRAGRPRPLPRVAHHRLKGVGREPASKNRGRLACGRARQETTCRFDPSSLHGHRLPGAASSRASLISTSSLARSAGIALASRIESRFPSSRAT